VRLRTLTTVALALLAVTAAIAQTGAGAADPVSGKWGNDGLTYLELSYDGKATVTGSTIWRSGDWESRAVIRTGSFDPQTGVLKLEGEAKGPDGVVRPYAIEGHVENETVSGTFKVGDDGGEFTFKKAVTRLWAPGLRLRAGHTVTLSSRSP